MKFKLAALVAFCLVSPAFSADPAPAGQAGEFPEIADDQVIADFKADLIAQRTSIMKKALTLTDDQAAKFWPLFDSYMKEQEPIFNEQIAATKSFADHYKNLTDAEAMAYVSSLLQRDKKITELRAKWLKKFQKAVPPKTAARAIHLDRRLSNLFQVQVSSQLPLVK